MDYIFKKPNKKYIEYNIILDYYIKKEFTIYHYIGIIFSWLLILISLISLFCIFNMIINDTINIIIAIIFIIVVLGTSIYIVLLSDIRMSAMSNIIIDLYNKIEKYENINKITAIDNILPTYDSLYSI
ncbi:unknown similar to AMEV144 [Choristoneura rosaceana entomopoxvirus 'L']|uniref:Uncharacterized protein n=1 Tax=Choristoneura rosaceana entomopoxvirus 'L' TaxID=1293539 RepID=A0ABM9QKI1_9POXV|nr:unknown similar to AMEV144 [Choristoneura rosaceana entomopoxvirus 'L']CCU56062.1 unknown similar to AMEV144 [Choristoneura rosaceana entomopoxvirus 'L']